MTSIKVGQTVETTSEQQGVVRYVGPIHVSDGIFIGIELSTPTGKNDGAVRGERYFTCSPGHGLFIRDSSIAQIISQAPPPRPTPTPSGTRRPPPPTTRPRPASVVPPKTAPPRPSTVKRQSVATASTNPPLRNRTASVASSSAPIPETPLRPSGSRQSLASSAGQGTAKASRDNNIETLQTKIRHLEKQHAEDQERLRELNQVKDERDRFNGIIQKLQAKCQAQYAETQDLKEKAKQLQSENEALDRAEQDHEVDLEDALVDKEMAEERADLAEAEVESLRKRLEESTLELDILRDEAEMFTTEMSEEQKEEAGYYRLQHENDRLRNALITLKEITEEKELDQKSRISSLEADLAELEQCEQENVGFRERLAESESLVEHLKQQLDAANTFEDVVEELSHKNQILSERIAEQDMIVQDLENLRELNDELEIQHLDQEQDMLAELEERNNELTEQAQRIVEQTAIITDNEFLIAKFRDLVMDLQNRMASAESSKSMTEAQVKDTTGRFNEVMDLNRQLRAATVQSTTREIEAGLITLRARQCDEKLDIWNETESKEFTRSESLQAYFLADRIVGKSDLLIEVLRATARQMSNGGRFDDAISRLVCSEAIRHLETLRDGSHRLWSAIRGLPLSGFATIGSTYQDLVTVEQALDQGLNALKTDTVNFEDLAGSLQRSTKTHEAVLMSHQEALAGRPEDELLSRIDSIKARLTYISSVYDLATFSLQKVPHSILEECEDTLEHFRSPLEATNGALSVATKLQRTLHDLHADSMYPRLPEGLDEVAQHDDRLAEAADGITDFARKLIDEVAKCSNLSDPDLISTHDIDSAKACIDHLDNSQRSTFLSSNITGLTTSLRHWADHSAVLSNNVEIEHGPTPWAQKANEVEAARKKDDEAGRQLQMLTVEHRTTVLKIHEREQVIATKELEIEHLKAKIRDATTKTEGVEALQEELAQHKEDIAELEDLNQSLKLELEAQRERAANAVQFDTKEAEPVTPNTTAAAEPAQQSSDSRSAPAGLRTFLDALQNENNWMRQRHCKDSFDRNLRDVFTKMDLARHSADYQDSMARLDAIELACLTDDDSEGLDTPPRASSPTLEESAPTYHIPNMEHPTRAKMSALELTGVSLGWEERARSHKVAFEAAEEDVMGLFLMAEEEEDSLMAWP